MMGEKNESQFLSVIRVWAALAWADGVIHEQEALAMKRLVETAGLGAADRAKAMGYLDDKIELDTAGLASLNPVARLGIYKAAVRLAGVDKDFADEEVQFLERLRVGLEIDEATARAARAEIPSPA
jgi:uncharacterized membrane protein YebE (DUF533 family)